MHLSAVCLTWTCVWSACVLLDYRTVLCDFSPDYLVWWVTLFHKLQLGKDNYLQHVFMCTFTPATAFVGTSPDRIWVLWHWQWWSSLFTYGITRLYDFTSTGLITRMQRQSSALYFIVSKAGKLQAGLQARLEGLLAELCSGQPGRPSLLKDCPNKKPNWKTEYADQA